MFKMINAIWLVAYQSYLEALVIIWLFIISILAYWQLLSVFLADRFAYQTNFYKNFMVWFA